MWRRCAIAAAAAGATALPATKISSSDCCTATGCLSETQLSFPATTYPNTPRFDFNVTGTLPEDSGAGAAPTFRCHGSLGLPHHPLGIFKFDTTGPACGRQRMYVEDGVLAAITVDFPPCPWSGSVALAGHVDVWTTIPAVKVVGPIAVSTGFTIELSVAAAAPANASLLCAKVGISQPLGDGATREQDHCTLDTAHLPQYPPAAADNVTIPWETIDLDADPATRWDHVVRPRAAEIAELIDVFIATFELKNSTLLRLILGTSGDLLLRKMPAEYASEIRGISKSTGINIGYLFLYNVAYELMGLCTSVVSQDAGGHLYHSRNLDFGIFMGTDAATHNWALTPRLRSLLFNARFVRGGDVLYNATAYAGYVGLLTGARRGGFSVSVDTRFDANIDRFLAEWVLGLYDGEFLSFKTRGVMEGAASYADALRALSHYKPMGPAYIIVGGAAAGEGAVVTISAGQTPKIVVRTLGEALTNGSFYVLQTNYDWSGPPPAYDDRRYPGMGCLDELGSAGVGWAALWGVHSSNPTRNALTTYTTLMSAETGHFEAYKQLCAPGPDCAPF